MILTASATKHELATLIASLMPLRVTIDPQRGRTVMLDHPELALVPGRGLRVRGDGRVSWDVAGLALSVTIQRWQVLLVPRVVMRASAHVLAFEPVVEQLDLRLVPGFVGERAAEAIRDAVAVHHERLAWNFTRTLSKRLALSTRLAPPRRFELRVVDGTVSVDEDELRVEAHFEAVFAAIPPSKDAEGEARDGAAPTPPPGAVAPR